MATRVSDSNHSKRSNVCSLEDIQKRQSGSTRVARRGHQHGWWHELILRNQNRTRPSGSAELLTTIGVLLPISDGLVVKNDSWIVLRWSIQKQTVLVDLVNK